MCGAYILHRQKRARLETFVLYEGPDSSNPPGYNPSDVPHVLYNGSLPVQWMCAIMSSPCSYPERTRLRRLGLIAFPHINHSTSCQDVSLGGKCPLTITLIQWKYGLPLLPSSWITVRTCSTPVTLPLLLQTPWEILFKINIFASKLISKMCLPNHRLPGL